MKALLTYAIIFVLLQYFVTGNLFIDRIVTDKGQLPHEISSPYSLTKGNPDPYVLPIEQVGRINFQHAQRIKLVTIEWEQVEISSRYSSLITNNQYSPFGNNFQTIPSYIFNCNLRI